MKILRIISRVLVGLVFIFSGVVKGVDPLGTTYKFGEYFHALGLDSMNDYAFLLAVIMIAAEFALGFALVVGTNMKSAAWGALLFMLFFTPLTLWLAVESPVSDCGCFGDAIVLTNWETFWKNVILLVLAIFIFFQRNKFKPMCKCWKQWLVTGAGIAIIAGIQWWSINHLPIIDFMPYKVGNNLPELMKVPDGAPKDVYEQFLTLEDTVLKKTIKVDMQTYTKDSTYWGTGTKYKYISISEPELVSKGAVPPIHDFSINSETEGDITDSLLNQDGYVFLFVAYKLEKANTSNMEAVNKLAAWTMTKGYAFIGLTSSLTEQIEAFKEETGAPFGFYSTDETTLKTMIRANPGIVVLKKGTVVAKYHSNDTPDEEEAGELFQ